MQSIWKVIDREWSQYNVENGVGWYVITPRIFMFWAIWGKLSHKEKVLLKYKFPTSSAYI